MQIDSGKLHSWDELSHVFDGGSILLGNGFSANIAPRFGYESLFDHARLLTSSDRRLFKRLSKSPNFELVLSGLAVSGIIAREIGVSTTHFHDCYYRIREALIEAVKVVHVPHRKFKLSLRHYVADHLRTYSSVYSTNYDLLLYWAVMSRDGKGFTDFFRKGGRFESSLPDHLGHPTRIFHLHGGLHLYRFPSGETFKRKSSQPYTLIDLSKVPHAKGEIPLFITEGHSDGKLTEIFRSDYLTHCYQQLREQGGPMVLFGTRLGQQESHILEALKRKNHRPMAVSIYPKRSKSQVKKLKRYFRNRLERDDISFFDSTTHPLGWPGLRIERATR